MTHLRWASAWSLALPGVGAAALALAGIGASFLVADERAWYARWSFVIAMLLIGFILEVVPTVLWRRAERNEKLQRFTNRLLAGVVVDPNRKRRQVTGITGLDSAVRVYNLAMGARVNHSSPELRYALEDSLARLESRDWDSLGMSLAVPDKAIQHAIGTIRGFLKDIDSALAASTEARTPDAG